MMMATGSDVSAVRACLSSRTASEPQYLHVAWVAFDAFAVIQGCRGPGLPWSQVAPTKAEGSVDGDFSGVAGRELGGRNKR